MSEHHCHQEGHQKGCGCGCSNCQCCSGHHHHHHHESDASAHFDQQLLDLADEAWMEVLKEKIKKQIEATGGKHLDELAKIVSEGNNERWKQIMSKQNHTEDFQDKIHNFFHKK